MSRRATLLFFLRLPNRQAREIDPLRRGTGVKKENKARKSGSDTSSSCRRTRCPAGGSACNGLSLPDLWRQSESQQVNEYTRCCQGSLAAFLSVRSKTNKHCLPAIHPSYCAVSNSRLMFLSSDTDSAVDKGTMEDTRIARDDETKSSVLGLFSAGLGG